MYRLKLRGHSIIFLYNFFYYFPVVFYFAGHGFEIKDKFMLPVDTPGPEEFSQSDGICERELLRSILSSNPKVFIKFDYIS